MKRLLLLGFLVLGVFILWLTRLYAGTVNVNPGDSIQNAINSASSGDTIVVAAGTYNGDVTLNKSNLAVKGTGTPKINGFIKLSSSGCTFDGFANGQSNLPNARPWCLLESTGGTVSNCRVENVTNSTNDDAVAFQLSGDHNLLLKCTVSNTDDTDHYRIFGDSNTIRGCESGAKKNTHYSNGPHADVIQSWGGISNALIEDCYFAPGSSNNQWGIINTASGSQNVTFRNCIFVGGEHIFLFVPGTKLQNCVFYKMAKNIGDLFFLDSSAGITVTNCALVDCGSSASSGWTTGSSNVNASNNFFSYNGGAVSHSTGNSAINGGDPKFVNVSTSDFHLQNGSPLIGKGIALSPAFPDKDGNTRTAPWDIAAYQKAGTPATPTPTPTPPPASNKFKVGDKVVTLVNVNVRSIPAGSLVGVQNANSTATVTSSPASPALFDGAIVQWWSLTFASSPSGYVGEDNLALSAATPTPSPSSTPSPTPSPSPSSSPSPTPPAQTFEQWIKQQNDWIRANPPYPDVLQKKEKSD